MTNELQTTSNTGGFLTVHELRDRINLIQEHMKFNLKEKEHYGIIPGCGTKKVLLKSGAEKLLLIFGLAATFTHTIEDLGDGHRDYRSTCRLTHRASGQVWGEGQGSCSTKENKYRWRKSERVCPTCGANTIIKGKEEYGGGFICFAKKGGCGAKFKDGDPSIESQQVGQTENPDIADCYNTCMKMADKRSLVAACLFATACSDIFTQDVEDLPDYLRPRDPSPTTDNIIDAEYTKVAITKRLPENLGEYRMLSKSKTPGVTGATLEKLFQENFDWVTNVMDDEEKRKQLHPLDLEALIKYNDELFAKEAE